MKLYQMVNAADGTRSEPVVAASFQALAAGLKEAVAAAPSIADNYILVLLEDADATPYVSRAPMMLVSSVIAKFGV